LSPAELWFEPDQIHVRSRDAAGLRVGIFPAPDGQVQGFAADGQDGVFQEFCARVATRYGRGGGAPGAARESGPGEDGG
jgi:hypothetical protein